MDHNFTHPPTTPMPTTPPAAAAFRFAQIYQDHMVLQREPYSATVWGFGEPHADVALTLADTSFSFNSTTEGVVDADGTWLIALPRTAAGGPYNLTATSSSSSGDDDSIISLTDVLFGELWVCGGQSNMAFTVGTPLADPNWAVETGLNASEEIADSVNYPDIRVMTVGDLASETPIIDFYPSVNDSSLAVKQQWVRAQPDSVGSDIDVMGNGHFSAVCFYYGRELNRELGVPIGLIHASWGGTSLEDWLDADTLQPDTTPPGGDCPGDIAPGGCGGAPTQQYNGMIAPLQRTTVRGVIFYQGESNWGVQELYSCRFTKLMNQYSAQWTAGTRGATDIELPFGIVQIGPMTGKDPSDNGTFAIRQGQTASFGYCPNPLWRNTFLAAAYDLPNADDTVCTSGCVHIYDKQDVGHRLAQAARGVVYGQDVLISGPLIESVTADLVLKFDATSCGERGLDVRSDLGLEVQVASNGTWLAASVASHDATTVTLADPGFQVAAVRYAFADQPCPLLQCALYNSDGLPSTPWQRAVGG